MSSRSLTTIFISLILGFSLPGFSDEIDPTWAEITQLLERAESYSSSHEVTQAQVAEIQSRVSALLADPGRLKATLNWAIGPGLMHSSAGMAQVLGFTSRISDSIELDSPPPILAAVRNLLGGMGLMTASSGTDSEVLSQRMGELERLSQSMETASQSVSKFQGSLRRLRNRFATYQVLLSAAAVGGLVQHFEPWIAQSGWMPSNAQEFGVFGLAFGLKNLLLFKTWWGPFRNRFGRSLQPSASEDLKVSLRDLLQHDQAIALPFLVELAHYRSAETRGLEDASIETLLERKNDPEVAKAILEIVRQSLEEGHFERAMAIGTKFLDGRVAEENSPYRELGAQLRELSTAHKNLKGQIARKKRQHLRKQIVLTLVALGAGGSALHVTDPEVFNAVRVLSANLVAGVGLSKLMSYLWFRYPTEKMRDELLPARDRLTNAFAGLLQDKKPPLIDFVAGIATVDPHTHTFIREAARDALLAESSHNPAVAQALLRLGLANIRNRGKSKENLTFIQGGIQGLCSILSKLR